MAKIQWLQSYSSLRGGGFRPELWEPRI